MIRLHYANRMENLIEPLAQGVAEQQARRPLDTVIVVLPDCFVPGPFGDLLEPYHALEQFVRFKLAQRLSVAANLDFPPLRAYLAATLERIDSNLRVISRQDLQLAVFECLRMPPFKSDPELAMLGRAGGVAATDEEAWENETFELAARLGHLLYEYAGGRPAMLHKWRAGSLVAAEPYRRVERLQRRLYLSLFDSDKTLRPQWIAEQNQRRMLLPDALEAVAPSSLKCGLPSVLHFFGCLDADPLLARALALLGAACDLRVYALNPCGEFWETVADERGFSLGAGTSTASTGSAAKDADFSGPADAKAEHDGAERDCAALRLWARSGRGLTRVLNELSGYDFESHFTPAAGDGQQSLLGALKDSVLNNNNALEHPAALEGEPAPDSAAIRFLACPGSRREVEAVADAIWSLIQENDRATAAGASRLRFHEIALLFPDSQGGAYLPHIEAVLGRRYRIPLNVVSRPLAGESRVAQAIDFLLDLPLGRFTRAEVVRLLTHPAITGVGAEAEVEQWRQWCEELGIVFGADARDFAGTYIPKDVYHWDQALRRLSLGVFMMGERGGRTELFRAQDGCAYLPFEVDQGESRSVAKLVRSARGLLGSALELKHARLVPVEWADVLIKLVKKYVQAEDSAGERVLDCCLRALESIAPRNAAGGAVGYGVARRLAARRLAQAEAAHGNCSYTGLIVGPLSALRALPFRAIFFLGLGAVGFPERDRPDWRDLRLDKREREDLPLTERQRYWFLQTLLAAHERVFLSYSSLDPQTGDPLEPSVVVHELRTILRGWVDQPTLARMTTSPPLSRYDLERFPDLRSLVTPLLGQPADSAGESAGREREPVSFDIAARQAAEMIALREDLERHCAPLAAPQGAAVLDLLAKGQGGKLARRLRMAEDRPAKAAASPAALELSLPLAALRRFLECPIQGTGAYALGMLEDEPVEIEDDEPLSQSRVQRVGLLRDAFWRGRGDLDAADSAYREAFRVEQAKGRAPFGPFARAQQDADMALMREWIRLAREAGLGNLARWQHVVIGHTGEFAEGTGRILPMIRLDVPRRSAGGDMLCHPDGSQAIVSVGLFGRLAGLSARLEQALVVAARESAAPKDFLGPFIWALALRAAGVLRGNRFETIVIAAGESRPGQVSIKTLPLPPAPAARAYLTNLADDLLSANSGYFLPVEAVAAVLSSDRSANGRYLRSPREIVRRLRDDGHISVSSAYGPVRNARGFPVPRSDDEVERIIERRFGLLRQVFA